MLAIIGGTGLTNLTNLTLTRREVVRTPYGEPSGHLTFGRIGEAEMVFLARHGYAHSHAPHEVNYRANIWALAEAGVQRILAVNAVGGIAPEAGPGALIVPDQIIDYTHGRKHTFFEGSEPVTHIDFTEPFCARARHLIADAARGAGHATIQGGVLGVTQGPRLETRAEVLRMKNDGCTIVGMTTMPEAALAREKKMSYATLALSMNHAAGLASSAHGIKLTQADAVLATGMEKVRAILAVAVALYAALPASEKGLA